MQLVRTCHAGTARPGWIKSPNPSRRCLPYQPTDGRKVSPPTCCTQYAHAASPHTDFPTGGRPQGMRSGSTTTGWRCARCRWWPSRGLGCGRCPCFDLCCMWMVSPGLGCTDTTTLVSGHHQCHSAARCGVQLQPAQPITGSPEAWFLE